MISKIKQGMTVVICWVIAVCVVVLLCAMITAVLIPGYLLRAIGTILVNAGTWARIKLTQGLHWLDLLLS